MKTVAALISWLVALWASSCQTFQNRRGTNEKAVVHCRSAARVFYVARIAQSFTGGLTKSTPTMGIRVPVPESPNPVTLAVDLVSALILIALSGRKIATTKQ